VLSRFSGGKKAEEIKMAGVREKALSVIKYLPRVALNNLRDNPHSNWVKKKRILGSRREVHWPHKGHKQRQGFARLGFEGGQTPFYLRVPFEAYNKGFHLRRQYPPLSLGDLQLMIDTNRLDPNRPIDLATLCGTNLFHCNPIDKHFGVKLTSDGIDCFKAKINIEVQHADEAVIAAVERNGGVICTSFYDINSVEALVNPGAFFKKGFPIPKRLLPPEDAFAYYTDPGNRGYLADPAKISLERLKLSQKYGYELPDVKKDDQFNMLSFRKDPRQLFEGLQPGWVVNLKDKIIMKPIDSEYIQYYSS